MNKYYSLKSNLNGLIAYINLKNLVFAQTHVRRHKGLTVNEIKLGTIWIK